MKYLVMHGSYGCDTGCCGHFIEDEKGETVKESWRFDHPYDATTDEARHQWALEYLRDHFGDAHIADLDWENCIVSND